MSKRTAPKDFKASGFKAFFTSGTKKSPPLSTATTPEPDNPGSSTPEKLKQCFNLTLVNSSQVLAISRAFALNCRIFTLLHGSAKRSDAFCENIQKLLAEASKTAIPKMSILEGLNDTMLFILFQQWRDDEGNGRYEKVSNNAAKFGDIQIEDRRG